MSEPFRKAHSLPGNIATPLPWQAVFVDTETKEIPLPDGRTELVFKMGWASFWRRNVSNSKRNVEWYEIPSIDAFWNWLENKTRSKTKLYLFAFNLFFDMSILKGQKALLDRGWKAGYPYYHGKTGIHRWRKGNKTIMCLDVGNFFPTSVAKIAPSVGLEKGDVDFDTVNDVTLSTYCKLDVEIIMRAMLSYFDFLQIHDLGGFRVTAPSQSMGTFRHKFMRHKIWLHGDKAAVELERESYHGGRVTILYQGRLTKGPYYKLDYNSAYAAVYGKFHYPYNLNSVGGGLSLAGLEKRLKTHCLIANVDLFTDEPAYPVLHKNRLYFPIGGFNTTLTTRELIYALRKGHLHKVRRFAIYQRGLLFKNFVDHFYDLRLEYKKAGNKSFEIMIKMILNGFSGKWGQHDIKRTVLGTADPYEMHKEQAYILDTNTIATLITYGGKRYLETKEGESYHAFPAIVAHITADLRMKLWSDIQQAGLENCYNMDTDSLFVNQAGYDNLESRLDAGKLGYLKVEGISEQMTIYAPKDYRFGNTLKRKGVPKRAHQLADNRFRYDEFQGWSGAMSRDEIGRIITTPIEKTLYRKVKSGKLANDGRVLPFNFPEDIGRIIDPQPGQKELGLIMTIQEWMPKIPQQVIFAVWDYRTGDFRRARDKDGKLAPLIYSKWDHLSTELGFAHVDEFTKAVIAQVRGRQF